MSATGLDQIFHERGRLAICSALVASEGELSFVALQEACGLTDGNLNRHLHALAEAGVVSTERRTGSGRPQTTARITPGGWERFFGYIDALEEIVRDVQASAKTGSPARARPARTTSQ